MSRKYSAGEWIAVMVIAPMATSMIVVAMLPLMLLMAWMRVKMWDWFAVPYLHLPHIGVWLMLAVGLFISTLRVPIPSLKPEMYSSGATARLVMSFMVAMVEFGIAWAIHTWILTGGAR